MTEYSVFGGRLRSQIPLPALDAAGEGEPRWTLAVVDRPRALPTADLLGEDEVDPGVGVRLFRHALGYRLVYEDTGTFDVLDGGALIEWHPRPGADACAAALDVLGRVIPTSMHAAGTLCLHGSAVALGGQGVAFLAPKYHGKSTLAHALVRAGAGLLTDDVVPVDPGPPARVSPGVQRLRLWSDSASRLGGVEAPGAGEKHVVEPGAVSRPLAPVPLAAVYLLAPVRAAPGRAAARRAELATLPAALALLGQSRLGLLLGRTESVAMLDRAARLAETVPVYTLEVVRDFDRLGEVVERLTEWHPPVPALVAT